MCGVRLVISNGLLREDEVKSDGKRKKWAAEMRIS